MVIYIISVNNVLVTNSQFIQFNHLKPSVKQNVVDLNIWKEKIKLNNAL